MNNNLIFLLLLLNQVNSRLDIIRRERETAERELHEVDLAFNRAKNDYSQKEREVSSKMSDFRQSRDSLMKLYADFEDSERKDKEFRSQKIQEVI